MCNEATAKRQLKTAKRRRNFAAQERLKENEDLIDMRREVAQLRLDMRERIPTIDAILRVWDMTAETRSDRAERLFQTYGVGGSGG